MLPTKANVIPEDRVASTVVRFAIPTDLGLHAFTDCATYVLSVWLTKMLESINMALISYAVFCYKSYFEGRPKHSMLSQTIPPSQNASSLSINFLLYYQGFNKLALQDNHAAHLIMTC